MTCWHFGGSLVWRDVEMQQWHVFTAGWRYEKPAAVTNGDAGLAPNLDGSTPEKSSDPPATGQW